MKPLPPDALTVFQLGGWSALADYAPQIASGTYECPNVRHATSTYHPIYCNCGGTQELEFDHQSGGNFYCSWDR